MKITFLQVEEAFARALWGESVRSIARSMGVTEGCIRFHFRKCKSPREVRRMAFDLVHAQQALARLSADARARVDRRITSTTRPAPPSAHQQPAKT